MKLLLATNNAHKAREMRQILAPYFASILTLSEARLDVEVIEDGATFAANAQKKAVETLAAAPAFDAVLADDSGLCVDALNGAPGVLSARYAGPQHDMRDNIEKLLYDMRDVPENARGCRFVCAVSLARRGLAPLAAEGRCEGVLLRQACGANGFGYDPYFFYPPLGRAFAELEAEQKNAVSHRRLALDALRRLLENAS